MLIRQIFSGVMPQLVMFDLDGTLVDSLPDLAVAVDAMLEALGKASVPAEKVKHWIGNGVPVLVQRALRDAGMADVAENMKSLSFQEALGLFSEAYDDACGRYSVVYDGVYECLNALQDAGVPMAVVTNKSERFTHDLLKALGLDHYFPFVVCGDTLKGDDGTPVRKPDPAVLLYAAKRYGADIGQSLMVGDSRHDVASARAAGCRCVAVPYGYNHGEPVSDSRPDKIVESLDELIL